MDVDQSSFSKQISTLKALIDTFDGQLDDVTRRTEEVEATQEDRTQTRRRLRARALENELSNGGDMGGVLATAVSDPELVVPPVAPESVPPLPAQEESYEFKYVGPGEPVDITMDEAGQLRNQSSRHLKRRREDEDTGTAANAARVHREWQALCKGKAPNDIPPAHSILSSSYSSQYARDSGRSAKAELGQTSTKRPANRYSDLSDGETNDYGSDSETVAALYEHKRAAKDKTIKQVMTLLDGLVDKVNNLLEKLPPEPAPVPKGVHPIVAQHLVASGKRQPAAPRDNFLPWNQNEEDERPMEPAYIRVVFAECLGRKSKKDPLPPGPPDDVKSPSPQSFWVKWSEPYNSEFNSAACEIVTRKVMVDFPTLFLEEFYEELFKMVAAHMKYNIVLYRRQNLPPGDSSETKRLAAASSNRRRHTLFQKRLYITQSVKALRVHRRLLKDLGIEGTSSDEEDPHTPGLFRVKRIKQLSSGVVQLKQKLDDTFEALVKVPGRKGNRGRKRVRTAEASQRKFRIKGLPVNCVNRIWYSRLSAAQKGFFKFVEFEYDFKFPDELLGM